MIYFGREIEMIKPDIKRDEREHKLLTESVAAAGFVAYFYGIIVIIIKLLKTKDFSNVYVEFGLIMAMVLAMFVHRIITRNYDIPTTISGKVLPTGSSQVDKRARLSYYIKDTLRFTVVWTIFEYQWKGSEGLLFKTQSIYLSLILDGLLGFIFIFALNYFWYERNVKKYRAYCESLEDELDTEEDSIDEWWDSTDSFDELEDVIQQRKCPKCEEVHDIDYPKCPKCKHDYYADKE